MCGRFTLQTSLDQLQLRFDFSETHLTWQPRYNIAPTQPVLGVIQDGTRHLTLLRWGLIPSWAKDPAIGNRLINARAETLPEKASFRNALRRRRCLVLADGFYEWQKRGSRKVPMFLQLASGEPFGMAGLWEVCTSPSGEKIQSCTIITTTPNELVAPIHDRMPVILRPETESLWLDPTLDDPVELTALLQPLPAAGMRAHPVSSLVNSPQHDSPDCIRPVA